MLGAAAYNLLVAVPGLVLGATVNDRIVALLVGCFGLVYAMVARDPVRLGPVLWAGVVGKIGVVALMRPQLAGRTELVAGGRIAADVVVVLDVSRSMLAELDDVHGDLVRAARPETERLAHALRGTGAAVLLFNTRGVVIELVIVGT